jgi:hypothetical protein
MAKPPKSGGGGRFQPGQSGNPNGRPRKANSVGETVRKALDEKVVVTEGGRRRRMSKGQIAAAQMANKGAAGDLRATKTAFEIASKAEDREASTPVSTEHLTASDEQIVERLVARLRRIDNQKERPDEPDYSI